MDHGLGGRTVLVTGAARGMGSAIALAFAGEGARVILLGRSLESLGPAVAAVKALGGDALGVACNVAQPEQIRAAVARSLDWAGRIHVLVNNAGISGEEAPFLSLSEQAWDEMLAVNLKGPFLLSQRVARHMAERGEGGAILHNASISGLGVDGPYSHYSASKAGLLALTRSMAVELAPHRIRVNAVSPGYTRTDMTMGSLAPDQREFVSSGFVRVPMGRVVEPEEVAQAFVFLASSAASGITGANLVVDGGLTANLYIMETIPQPGLPAGAGK